MATGNEIESDVNDFWLSWDGKGNKPRPHDIAEGNMRRKGREFLQRKKVVDERKGEYESIREKYKRREQ